MIEFNLIGTVNSGCGVTEGIRYEGAIPRERVRKLAAGYKPLLYNVRVFVLC